MSDSPSPLQQALALHQRGRLEAAERAYRDLLAEQAENFDATHLLGMLLLQRGEAEAALPLLDEAVRLGPEVAEAHCNRGHALRQMQRIDEALTCFDRAWTLKPDYFEAGFQVALLYKQRGDHIAAIKAYDRLLAIKPNAPQVLHNRGLALHDLGRRADALKNYDQALALNPASQPTWRSRGNALCELGRFDEARTSFDRAIALKPDDADAIKARGMLKLLLGDFISGWKDYVHRPVSRSGAKTKWEQMVAYWEGESLAGRSIAITAATGLGDNIQFCRYLPMLAARGATVTFRAPPSLLRVLAVLSPRVQLVAEFPTNQRYDYRCNLLSLPQVFGTDLDSVPQIVPYLRAEPDLVAKWRARLGGHGLRVGVCWQGNPGRLWDARRSFPASAYLPLARLPGVRLISLQKGQGSEQLERLPASLNIEALGDDFDAGADAFVDTAAVIASLDLVICPDTSINHLAGALGCPSWLALQKVPEWRWMLDRRDSPWYPGVRLFRQSRDGEWGEVFEQMAAEMAQLVARRVASDLVARP